MSDTCYQPYWALGGDRTSMGSRYYGELSHCQESNDSNIPTCLSTMLRLGAREVGLGDGYRRRSDRDRRKWEVEKKIEMGK